MDEILKDALAGGVGISKDGVRIAPEDFYKEREMPDKFWVVERWFKSHLHFWSAGARGRGYADDWSTDIAWATKLCDRESADQILLHIAKGEGRSVQHCTVAAS